MPGSVDMMTAPKFEKFRQEPQDPAGKLRPREVFHLAPRCLPSRTTHHASRFPYISAGFLPDFCMVFRTFFWITIVHQPLTQQIAGSGFRVRRLVASFPTGRLVGPPSTTCRAGLPRQSEAAAESQAKVDQASPPPPLGHTSCR
jgi:hypothetical protein